MVCNMWSYTVANWHVGIYRGLSSARSEKLSKIHRMRTSITTLLPALSQPGCQYVYCKPGRTRKVCPWCNINSNCFGRAVALGFLISTSSITYVVTSWKNLSALYAEARGEAFMLGQACQTPLAWARYRHAERQCIGISSISERNWCKKLT